MENSHIKSYSSIKESNLAINSPKPLEYFTLLGTIYIVLATLHYYTLQPLTLHTQTIFIITLITNIPLSYMSLQTILSFHYGNKGTQYNRKKLTIYPKTAVILGVYNDFTPEKYLENMKKNPGFDYWILSDSNPEQKKREEKVSMENGINYLHRGNRRGKKAGAINDWAELHLWRYKYYFTLDKDSLLKENNINDLIEIAEHPSNTGIAAFQTMIYSLAGNSRFSYMRAIVANIYVTQFPRNDALALGVANYWGHNALLRSEAFIDVGGQDETHLNEDISYSIKLRENGWNIAYITEVTSFEEQPGDLASEWERLARWMRGSYESTYLALSKINKIGIESSWIISLAGIIYFTGVLLFLLVLITAVSPLLWDYSLIGSGVSELSRNILVLHMYGTLFIGPVLPFIKSRKAGKAVFMIILNTLITMPGILRSTYESLKFLFFREAPWSPTRIESSTYTVKESIVYAFPEFMMGVLLLILVRVFGTFSGFIQLSPWILSFMASPFVVYYTSKSFVESTIAIE